jgi:hypothetical protein
VEGKDLDEVMRTFKLDSPAALAEQTKSEDGKDFPPGDYAYVPDKESPSTWKLRLTATPGGTPDSGIVGAAIAALGKGFRGNKVSIPAADLPAVKAKVRAAWKKANPDKDPADMPPAIAEAELAEAATIKAKVRGIIKALDELLDEKEIPENIRSGVKGLRETFRKTWADLANETTGSGRQAESEPQEPTTSQEHFAESYGGAVIMEDAAATNPARAPLTMRVQLIRPGWGNSKDMHYYPPEVLKRDAHVFEGVKMYTTDHKAGEKSERTEVSVIEKIDGFTDDGAPIAKVNVFDPDFAEKVRNRKASGTLDRLECSVLGEGTSKPFEKDGKRGKMIESITNAESVDWVTRAGAGGKALDIAESEPNTTNEGVTMTDQVKVEVESKSPAAETVAPVAEAVSTATAEPTRLSEVEVTALLEAEKRLPAVSRVRLAEGQYKDAAEVSAAATKELAYLKDILGSGQPFGLGAAPPAPKKSPAEALAEANAALDAVNKKYGMTIGGNK